MPPRSYIEGMDRPTVLYILYYTMVSAQQTNLLPKNASRNDAIFAQKVYQIYATTSQYLSSYGCAITIVYSIIYNTTSQSIASIYDLSGIFTSALHALVNMSAQVVYIGYGPPTILYIYITYCSNVISHLQNSTF